MATIVYGIHPVHEMLKNSRWRIAEVHLDRKRARRRPLDEIAREAEARGISIVLHDDQTLRKLAAGGVHQGVVAVLEGIPYASMEDILMAWRNSGQKATILVLDGVQDPHNLGAIVRTAHCAGCHGIILPRDRSASLTPAAIKASAGAAAHIPVARVTNLASALNMLRQEGIWIVGTAAEAGTDLFDSDLDLDLALAMGGEGKGLRPLVGKRCDLTVRIPMIGINWSLNVSVAAGVILFEILRQRRLAGVSS
ncbi:MAG: 23S rRNA (guanosine(2251)-2'-O)-methyltransferase RlmB [Deltaproteobacteria bacterium]|nr:23S rRNA (guanosine(2251)-2'-O)-methyltransferase RlmB [Deltaproteobacteria bacterium]